MLPVKKFLMECRKEQIEIEILTQQQDYLRASLLPRSIAPRDMDVQTSTPGDHMADTFARVADYEAEIIRHRERLLKRQALARRVIDQLDQTLHRQVLTLYYLGAPRITWEQVAKTMGYSEQHIYELHGWALKAAEEIFQRESEYIRLI